MSEETPQVTQDDQAAYGELIAIAMRETKTSARNLEKMTGITRHRIATIVRNGDATRKEQQNIFAALGLDPLRAYLAIDQLRDPAAYFGAVAETVANFTHQFTTQLEEQSEAREGNFEPIRHNLLTPLVIDVTARVMRHQDLCSQRAMQFLG